MQSAERIHILPIKLTDLIPHKIITLTNAACFFCSQPSGVNGAMSKQLVSESDATYQPLIAAVTVAAHPATLTQFNEAIFRKHSLCAKCYTIRRNKALHQITTTQILGGYHMTRYLGFIKEKGKVH